MDKKTQPALQPPAGERRSDWESKARLAAEARRAASEIRRGRPASFVAAVGMAQA